jgi:hypothetical protein
VPRIQLNAEARIGQKLGDEPFKRDQFFLRHAQCILRLK